MNQVWHSKDCVGELDFRSGIYELIKSKVDQFLKPIWVLLVGLLLCLPLLAEATDFALVIGISKYDYDGTREGIISLEYPDDDALELKEVLESKGYTVFSRVDDDAEREDIISAFVQLRDLITEDDSFILFFAGHGMRDARIGQTFWLTHDAKLSNLDHNGIRLSHLMDYIGDIKARKKLVLLDHCFSGDVKFDVLESGSSRSIDTIQPNISRGALPIDELREVAANQSGGIAIMAAARDQAFEHDEYKNGLFTEALIRAMNTRDADSNNDGALGLAELEQFLSSEMAKLSDEQDLPQTPVSIINAQGVSEWTLFPLPIDEPNAAEISAEYKSVLARWSTQNPPWVVQEIKFRIYKTLNAWVDAEADLASLNSIDRVAIRNLQANMNFYKEGFAEESTVADALNNELKHIYGIE
ncbi:MAG: caspase family protein [bacterium]